jgi:hypothetical protein
MSVEHSVEWLARKTEILVENLLQFHFVHHKYHATWPGRGGKPATTYFSYVAAKSHVTWPGMKSGPPPLEVVH